MGTLAYGSFAKTGRADDAWLVKSGDEILGPLSSLIIEDKILSRELVILDEVAPPEGRWRLIRDEPVFAAVVEESRRSLMNVREETEVGGFESTQIGASAPFERSVNDNVTPVSNYQDVHRAPQADYESTSAKEYGIRDSAKGAPRLVWALAVVAVLIAIYLITTVKHPGAGRQIAALDFDRTLSAAKMAWDQGNFPIAEKLYSEAHQERPDDPAIVAKLAPLLLQIENQTVEAKRLIGDMRAKHDDIDAAILQEFDLGLALAALLSGDQVLAERLLKDVDLSPRLKIIAQFNLGMAAFAEDRPAVALESFEAAGNLRIAEYMKVRSLLVLADRRSSRREAATTLIKLAKDKHEFFQESQILSASLLFESGNKKGAEARIRAALNADPEMTSQMWRDPLLYQSGINWKPLVAICRRLHAGLKSPLSKGMVAFCLNKAGLTEDASRTLGEALDEVNSEPLLQALNSLFLYQAGRDDDARAALRMVFTQAPVPALAQLVQARLCTRSGDFPCAEERWKSLVDDSVLQLPAKVGLAMMYQRQGKQKESQALIAQILTDAPEYKPALQLNSTISGVGL